MIYVVLTLTKTQNSEMDFFKDSRAKRCLISNLCTGVQVIGRESNSHHVATYLLLQKS